MTHTPFARRRRKVSVLRQQVQQLEPILTTMNTLLRILFCIALLITGGLAALQYLALVPPGMIPQDWIIKAGIAATLLGGLKEGIVAIGDILDDGVRNGSFKPGASHLTRMLTMLLFVGMVSFMLASCVNDRFLGLDSQGWQKVMMNGGKQLGKEAPGVFFQAYTQEAARPKTSAKQPVPVQPDAPLLLPSVQTTDAPEGERAGGWLGPLINIFN